MTLIEFLKSIGAIGLSGHYRLASGKHSNAYVDMRAGFAYPQFNALVTEKFSTEIMRGVSNDTIQYPDLIVGFGNCGPVLASLTAQGLAQDPHGERVRCIWCVPNDTGDGFIFPPKMPFAQMVSPGMTAVIVDDLLTTGSSMKKQAEFLAGLGVEVSAGIVGVCRTDGIRAVDCGVPELSALEFIESGDISLYDPGKKLVPYVTGHDNGCPLCEAGVPMRRGIAHNDTFLDENPAYPVEQ